MEKYPKIRRSSMEQRQSNKLDLLTRLLDDLIANLETKGTLSPQELKILQLYYVRARNGHWDMKSDDFEKIPNVPNNIKGLLLDLFRLVYSMDITNVI